MVVEQKIRSESNMFCISCWVGAGQHQRRADLPWRKIVAGHGGTSAWRRVGIVSRSIGRKSFAGVGHYLESTVDIAESGARRHRRQRRIEADHADPDGGGLYCR